MAETWVLDRLRSAFLRENMILIVLRLLDEEELTEWEILSRLHFRYGSTPTGKEFRRLCDLLVNGGYVCHELVGTAHRLRMTETGARLLRRLEEEYQAIVSRVGTSSGAVLTR